MIDNKKMRAFLILLAALALPAPADEAVITGIARALAGDALMLDGTRIQLAGIESPPPQTLCEGKITLWHCGDLAKISLARLVDGQTLRCTLRPGRGPQEAVCKLRGVDIGERQARAGWARTLPGTADSYSAGEAAARAERRGLWRNE